MNRITWVFGLVGLTLAVILFTLHNGNVVVDTFIAAGPALILVVCWHLVPMFLDTLGWRAVLGPDRPDLAVLLLARWIREGIDNLLPVAQVGGELVGARFLWLQGVSGASAAASVIADVTLAVCSQLVFTALGMVLLMHLFPGSSLVYTVNIAFALGVTGIIGFLLVQQRALLGWVLRRMVQRLGAGWGSRLADDVAQVETVLQQIYSMPRRWGGCFGWQLLSWLAGTFEVWLALRCLGHPISLIDAMLIESMVQAIRSAAFIVPGALGVQEAGYMLLGRLAGLDSEVGLALALVRRSRELLLGLPALLVWQWVESRRLFFGHRRRPQPRVVAPQREVGGP